LKERLDREEFFEAMMVMRLPWLRRNEYMFQGKFNPPAQIIMKAKELAAGFLEATQGENNVDDAVASIPQVGGYRKEGD
jgi:hypothetical protein